MLGSEDQAVCALRWSVAASSLRGLEWPWILLFGRIYHLCRHARSPLWGDAALGWAALHAVFATVAALLHHLQSSCQCVLFLFSWH